MERIRLITDWSLTEAHGGEVVEYNAVVLDAAAPDATPPGAGQPRFRAIFARAGRVRAAGGRPGALVLSEAALQDAALRGLFDGRAVFMDHARPGDHPSLRNLAGITAFSGWDAAGRLVLGELALYNTDAGQSAARLLRQVTAKNNGQPVRHADLGLSMVFYGELSAPLPAGGREIKYIDYVESVDLVFQPAAGGRVLENLSAARRPNSRTNPGTTAGTIHPDEEETCMRKNHDSETVPAAEAPPPEEAAPEAEGSLQAAPVPGAAVGALLKESGLPEASRGRLSDKHYPSAEAVRMAIESERAYLARLSADQVVKIGGQAPRGGHIQGGLSGKDQLQAALEALLAGTRPPAGVAPLSGIREAYLHLSGDYEMTGVFHPERIALAAVDSASMAGMVANALNKAIVNAFQLYPRWWEPFVREEDFTTLQTVRWITLGGVGELPTVSEGAAYTELTWDDQAETASFVKKGGYLGLTIEAIDKDDTRRLQSAPRALAQAAWLTLSKSISNIFTANSGVGPTMSDSLALFHNTHANLGSSALSIGTYAAARTAMRKQTELNSGERLGFLTAPRFLLVPPDLEVTALQVLASESDYSYALANGPAAPVNPLTDGSTLGTRLEFARKRVIVVDLWTDTNNWAAAADPMLYPTIGLGYRYGRTPEVFSVASPTAGLMFSNDVMPIKARYFYAVGPVDYRGLYKANVA